MPNSRLMMSSVCRKRVSSTRFVNAVFWRYKIPPHVWIEYSSARDGGVGGTTWCTIIMIYGLTYSEWVTRPLNESMDTYIEDKTDGWKCVAWIQYLRTYPRLIFPSPLHSSRIQIPSSLLFLFSFLPIRSNLHSQPPQSHHFVQASFRPSTFLYPLVEQWLTIASTL